VAVQRLDARRRRGVVPCRRSASGIALHPHFNHNDLYHVVQIAAMLLFYRGIRRF
jgi:hypothetical protein